MPQHDVQLKHKLNGILSTVRRGRSTGYPRGNSFCRMVVRTHRRAERFFAIFALYDTANIATLKAWSNTRTHSFFRIYVMRGFPYISFRWITGRTYKSYWLLSAKVDLGDTLQFAISSVGYADEEDDEKPICAASVVPHPSERKTFGTVRKEILAQLERDHAGDLSDERFVDLLGALEECKPADTETHYDDWLKTFILLNASQHANHRPARKALLELEARLPAADYNCFFEELAAFTKPYLMGPHGYRLAFAARDRSDLIKELHDAIAVIRDKGADAFINSGTLLGLHRDKDLIWYDDDFDLAVIIPGDTIDEIRANWIALCQALQPHFPVIFKGLFIAIRIAEDYEVDLFPAWAIDGRFYVYPYMYGDLASDLVTPLADIDVDGHPLPVPADVEAVLGINYGPDWRTPDPNWKFDWVSANKRFATERRELSLQELKEAHLEHLSEP